MPNMDLDTSGKISSPKLNLVVIFISGEIVELNSLFYVLLMTNIFTKSYDVEKKRDGNYDGLQESPWNQVKKEKDIWSIRSTKHNLKQSNDCRNHEEEGKWIFCQLDQTSQLAIKRMHIRKFPSSKIRKTNQIKTKSSSSH